MIQERQINSVSGGVGVTGSLKRGGGARTVASMTLRESYSEVERAKINQESLLKKVKVSHGLFSLLSLLLLIPYIALVELFLFGENDAAISEDVEVFEINQSEARFKRAVISRDESLDLITTTMIPELKNRLVLYLVPLVLLIVSYLMSWMYYRQVRISRDAARHWFSITPHRNRSGNNTSRNNTLNSR